MKKMIWIVGSVIALAVGAMKQGAQAAEPAGSPQLQHKAQTVCPVEGGEINRMLFADYDGKRVYFCCKGCPEAFQKAPAKYIRKLEQQGVKLEAAPKPAVEEKK